MSNLRPDRKFSDITDIRPEYLAEKGIKGLFLDIDGTLLPTGTEQPRDAVMNWIEDMVRAGIVLYVLSNNKSPERVRKLSEIVRIKNYVHKAGKPRREGFLRALQVSGLKAGETAMVGDQIFTDVFGANRAGIYSFLVPSCDTHLWYFGLRRFFEKPFMKETGGKK